MCLGDHKWMILTTQLSKNEGLVLPAAAGASAE